MAHAGMAIGLYLGLYAYTSDLLQEKNYCIHFCSAHLVCKSVDIIFSNLLIAAYKLTSCALGRFSTLLQRPVKVTAWYAAIVDTFPLHLDKERHQ